MVAMVTGACMGGSRPAAATQERHGDQLLCCADNAEQGPVLL